MISDSSLRLDFLFSTIFGTFSMSLKLIFSIVTGTSNTLFSLVQFTFSQNVLCVGKRNVNQSIHHLIQHLQFEQVMLCSSFALKYHHRRYAISCSINTVVLFIQKFEQLFFVSTIKSHYWLPHCKYRATSKTV